MIFKKKKMKVAEVESLSKHLLQDTWMQMFFNMKRGWEEIDLQDIYRMERLEITETP